MILPDNITRTIKQYRQKKQQKCQNKIQYLNNFMISRMRNFIKPQSYKKDFILNRRFQSQNLMKIKKRRQICCNIRDQRRKSSVDIQSLELSTISGQNYSSLTLNTKEPIHSRKFVLRKDYSSQIQKRKKDTIELKPFQHLLNISHVIQQHLHNKNNIHHQFLIRKHKTQRRNRLAQNQKPIPKLMFSDKKFQQYRPWSRQQAQNEQQVQPYSFTEFN